MKTNSESAVDFERRVDQLRRDLRAAMELRAQYRRTGTPVPPALVEEHYGIRRDLAETAGRAASSSEGPVVPSVFAIMPFRQPFDDYYAKVIKPAVVDVGMTIKRSDDVFSPGAFVQTIWSEVLAADAVVAEMTGANPNVLYELGLAHAVGKTVVMLTQSIEDVPADLRHINCIVYDTTLVNWADTLRSGLQAMLLFKPQGNPKPVLDPPASIANTKLFGELVDDAEQQRTRVDELETEIVDASEKVRALTHERDALETGLSNALAGSASGGAVIDRKEGGVTSAVLSLPDGEHVMEFVRVPKGGFVVGAADRAERVELPPYWISRLSVTNRLYCAFLRSFGNQEEGGSDWIDLEGSSAADRCRIRFQGGRFRVEDGFEDHPVAYVNFFGAAAFCAWVGGALPTVEEWEKAVRGTDGRQYPWGNAPPRPDLVNIGEDGWARDVAPIAAHLKPAGQSPYGVVQGIGNVWHWTSTYFPDRGVQAVRGGAFFDYRLGQRNVYRFQVHPDGPDFSQGFLVARRFMPEQTPPEGK